MARIVSVIFLLIISYNSFGQKEVDNQSCAWYMYFGNHRVSDRVGIHTEYQWRRYDLIQYWQQSLLRIGIEYYTKTGPRLSAGYGWIRSFPYGEQPVPYAFHEHRIWEQLILNQQAGRFYFNHRFRLEQRFIETKKKDAEGVYQNDGFNFRQRVRYRIQVSIPISRKEMIDNTLFIAFYDEIFVNFGAGTQNHFDQNRLYAALGWRFNSNFNIQSGYLNQYILKSDGIHVENNHVFQLALFYNIDFRNKD